MAIAIVVAAGSGERLGAGTPKAIVDLHGRPMLAWSARALARAVAIEQMVVAVPPGYEARVEVIVREAAPALAAVVVAGGDSRSESVRNALAAAVEAQVVVVHDAARPLVRSQLFDRCIEELERGRCDGVVAGTRVTDTIKRVDNDGRVIDTLDRSRLWSVQTPQVFRADALRDALQRADVASATDDAQLVERNGGVVRVVETPAENFKVTTPADLALAELLMADAD